MSKKSVCLLLAALLVATAVLSLVACNPQSEYDDKGRMILNLRNLYFSEWTGGDTYTAYVEKKFNVQIKPTSYSWADWDNQVYSPINANNLTDVFHFSLDNYNFANSYEFWAKGGVIKALPDDLSGWPNVQKLLSGINNIDSLKINGKLYCIPVAKNIKQTETEYSPFTYVYRRDWAKKLNVYQPDDEYTWDQFVALLDAFYRDESLCNSGKNGNFIALADVEWGFPSVVNFYKEAPHCYTVKDGQVVSTYTTSEYLEGLELAKSWVSDNSRMYYGYDQYAAKDGDVSKQYQAGRVGVFYENLSLSNYTTLRKNMSERSEIDTQQKLDDATAIMKVQAPDGKYALEGTDNWFSATFFSADISDEKMEKILDIMDWTLSDEGTEMAAYGFEGYDYEKDAEGNITLLEDGWEKDLNGNYIDKLNGVKYLRYMCTLGYDMNSYDPLVDKDALAILNDWYDFMDTQNQAGNLRILKEDAAVKWMSGSLKSKNSGDLLSKANTAVTKYVYGKIDKNSYLDEFNTKMWQNVLAEINAAFNK